MSEPSALASRALARHDNPWPSDDIRYTPSFEEAQKEIAALTRQQLLDFHSRFYGAGTISFAAVGAFDPEAVKAALTQEIGRASCRERVCQSVEVSVVAGSLKKKN